MRTQDKPRIRCRHYTPSYATTSKGMIYIRSATDASNWAWHVTNWEYVRRAACEALTPTMDRFHPRHIIKTAITLPCTGV